MSKHTKVLSLTGHWRCPCCGPVKCGMCGEHIATELLTHADLPTPMMACKRCAVAMVRGKGEKLAPRALAAAQALSNDIDAAIRQAYPGALQ